MNINETVISNFVLLLLGYRIGATIIGRGKVSAEVIVAPPESVNTDNRKACGFITLPLFGGLLLSKYLISTADL